MAALYLGAAIFALIAVGCALHLAAQIRHERKVERRYMTDLAAERPSDVTVLHPTRSNPYDWQEN